MDLSLSNLFAEIMASINSPDGEQDKSRLEISLISETLHKLGQEGRGQSRLSFSEQVYSFEVKEDTEPGKIVGYVQLSQVDGKTSVVYSVLEDDGDGLFLINPSSGEFLLSRALDFETEQLYILTAAGQYGKAPFTKVRVIFNVVDVNDNPPIFGQDAYSVTVPEDASAKTCFFNLNMSDADQGLNGEVTTAVILGDEETTFSLGLQGDLCLAGKLDREKLSAYFLTIQACDRPLAPDVRLCANSTITIHVEDVNDNAPAFISTNRLFIPEDKPLHSVVMVVEVEDKDSGANADVVYSLENLSGHTFRINSRSGAVYLQEQLDRELDDFLFFAVTVRDLGKPQLSSTMNVTVFVEDANDNDPEFTQRFFNLTILENIPRGTSILQVTAHDRDFGKNGQIRYFLSQGLFVVDSVLGVLSVMGRIDRERDPFHTLTVVAVDQGDIARSSTAIVNVSVSDVNDWTPVFDASNLTFHVLENGVDSQVSFQVSAVDNDFGANSQLTYFLENGNEEEHFYLHPNGTFKILHDLDRELTPQHTLKIIAVDSGLPPLTGTGTIIIEIDDVNDNKPVFKDEEVTTFVPENGHVGAVFATMLASDEDDGLNAQIRYSLVNTKTPFGINESCGDLFTTDVLDRETVDSYTLIVLASDGHATHPLSSSATVIVLVEDVNDESPQFLYAPYVANIPADTAEGSIVCGVTAVDADIGLNAKLTFSLDGQHSDLFFINPLSGAVFNTESLGGMGEVTITVVVKDMGDDPKMDSTTITIRPQRTSDFPVITVDVKKSLLSEDEEVGTLVAVVSAEQYRVGPVSFYLVSGNSEEEFDLNEQSGSLTVQNPLDYETNKEFNLLLEARDGGFPPFSSYAEVHINISDINDNYPVFNQSEYMCKVFENLPESLVCDVLAIDADSGSYGQVLYYITEGNLDEAFIIDINTGILRTAKSLDRETTANYNLTIEARDANDHRHTSTALVFICILDMNDHAPRFTQIFLTEIPEDAPVGYTIIQITAADEDVGVNALITYMLLSKEEELPFKIDKTKGTIVVAHSLDRETRDHYIVTVNANDSSWSVSTDVTIDISDANDNVPVFSEPTYSVTITETKAREVFVMKLAATDSDLGPNSQILYFIEPPSEVFLVNATTGDVLTKQAVTLLGTEDQTHDFTVIASDCGIVPLSSNVTVTVTFVKQNYFPPSFLPFSAFVPVPFNMDVGTEVLQLLAVDPDLPSQNNSIEFSVTAGNASSYFEIDLDNGTVFLMRKLKHSLNAYIMLQVTAKDKGFPSFSTEAEIYFIVINENQHTPYFPETFITFYVPEDLRPGSIIGRVEAADLDEGLNSQLLYYLSDENESFFVEHNSGLITLLKQLDFEKEAIHHLRVIAKDSAFFSRTGSINITINITDVNDNPPIFTSHEYFMAVTENSAIGTVIGHIQALDDDSGANGQIVYSLTSGHLDVFSLESQDGTITSLKMFNFEQERSFELSVKASNPGFHHLHTTAHVVIDILGINEFTPEFQKHEYKFSVTDSSPIGTEVGKVLATDQDFGLDGHVFYLLVGQSRKAGFEINQLTGTIYSSKDLRNWGNNHALLKVLAKNQGSISGFDVDEAIVHVQIIDANDPPKFHSDLYSVVVPEDAVIGTSIVKVTAEDQDVMISWSRFSYNIKSGNNNSSFSINRVSGVIFVNNPLDREKWAFFNLTVIAVDEAIPPATGTTSVVVTLTDVNDNAPVLMPNEGFVRENQPHGTVVATLYAEDDDIPPNQGPFTYWLTSSTGKPFSLTSDGVLFTLRPLDREVNSVFHLTVAVQDAGVPPLLSTATFLVKVLDENDNPPTQRNVYIEVKYFGKSFPGGFIGNVRPDDQDESDIFNCSIKNGPQRFRFPFGMCDLWSYPYQGEATYNITIEASDDLHPPVNNSVHVNYKGFSNDSLNNSVLFYILSSSIDSFLSLKYLKFVKALDSLFNIQASKTHVYGIKLLDNTILLLAAVKSYNGQYLSGELASSISGMHKKLLEAQSNVTILQITSDPCTMNPCHNGATCHKHIHIGHVFVVLESTAVIFVSPQNEIFTCLCPTGFTGLKCDVDIDECDQDPCNNDGVCVNYMGGFSCQCLKGFSGLHCSVVADECQTVACQNGGTCLSTEGEFHCVCRLGYEGKFCELVIDHCSSSPCLHGDCFNYVSGYTCQCHFGVTGVHCQEQSSGFEELSYMEFPPLDPRYNIISLEIATVQPNALILYNGAGHRSPEFLALEILNERLCLSYDLGLGVVKMETEKQVADGLFHNITIRRTGNIASLEVDTCPFDKAERFCFSQTEGNGPERTLDVGSGNLTFGGVKSIDILLLWPHHVKTHDFVGCMRNIKVNNLVLEASKALSTYNVLEWCPRVVRPCQQTMCLNGGVCHDRWFHHFCQCLDHFIGTNCATEMSEKNALLFNETTYFEYVIKESYRREQMFWTIVHGNETNVRSLLSLEIKVRINEDGMLLMCVGNKELIELKILDGKLVLTSRNIKSGQQSEFRVEDHIVDGFWHVFVLDRAGLNTSLKLDDQLVINVTNSVHKPQIDVIVLGAAVRGDTKNRHSSFVGCVEYIKYNGQLLPFNGYSEMVEVRPSFAHAQQMCLSQEHCVLSLCSKDATESDSCTRSPCPKGRDCGGHNCICLDNVTGEVCDSCGPWTEDLYTCLEPHGGAQLWIIGIVAPATIILITLCLFVALRKQRKSIKIKSQFDCLPAQGKQGTDNGAFCLDSADIRAQRFSGGRHGQPDVIAIEGHHEVGGSELDYYEIESCHTAFDSHPKTVQFSRDLCICHAQRCSLDANTERWSEEQHGVVDDHEIYFTLNQGGGHYRTYVCSGECNEHSLNLNRTFVDEFMEPPQELSVDEVRRLSPLLQEDRILPRLCGTQTGCRQQQSSSVRAIGSSSDSDTHSSFTCSEIDYERELICRHGATYEVFSEAFHDLGKYEPLRMPTPFRDNRNTPEAQNVASRGFLGGVEQWEQLLNNGLNFNTYAEVFADIACLPVKQQDLDTQSEAEEII
ncbi:protocadherin Fat 4 isoform X2 [Denticeps clupeoides]|uniref:protocadherin Fat 4 isoform X2 n=1 Tax=Denticeps clupeoides TaxID=299321 RepID=UPI0010A3D925|nr:protocadherin Fat 4-like isoform X2 [Denticeps clupeoides]